MCSRTSLNNQNDLGTSHGGYQTLGLVNLSRESLIGGLIVRRGSLIAVELAVKVLVNAEAAAIPDGNAREGQLRAGLHRLH